MKKWICLVLAGILLFSCTACQKGHTPSTQQDFSNQELVNSISSLTLQEAYDYAYNLYKEDPKAHRNLAELQIETQQIIVMDGQYYQSYVSGNVDVRYVFVSRHEIPSPREDFAWDWVAVGTKDAYALDQLGKIEISGK